MKKVSTIFLAILFIMICVMGCSRRSGVVSYVPETSQISVEQQVKEYEEEQAFIRGEDSLNYVRNDSILINDEEMPDIKSILTYTDITDNNDCNIAFVFKDGTAQELCFAQNEKKGINEYEILDENALKYIGTGTLTVSVRNLKTDEIYDYSVTYHPKESDATFIVKTEIQ